MSSSANGDQEQSKNTSMEESNAMTIEFLRARLLSERSVSKTARQRADELAKRVAELEEQLKFVSRQRKKAEKATADVLAILENRGISDVSAEFDSLSDPDESPHDFKARNGSVMTKETSTNMKLRNNNADAYSSSEIESSPSISRSLSWKSTKDSQNTPERKKYMDSVRRRASFASSSSSARRVGKSCRRTRRRETRSVEELENDGTEKATRSIDGSNCSDGGPVASRESSGYENGENPLKSPTVGSNDGTQEISGRYFSGREGDEDMESALQHQAQLIGQYEEEEKAQREWEEKFRENNSGAQDSCDPGNHSDVTEERYDIKSPEVSCGAGTVDLDNREMKQEPVDARFSEEPETSKNLSSFTDVDKGSLQDEKSGSGKIACESSASEFSFPMSKDKSDQELSEKQHETSAKRHQQHLPLVSTAPHSSANISSSQIGKSTPQYVSTGSSSSLNLAVVARETSDNLGSVLEALQRAKLSLNQKLNTSPGTSGNVITAPYPQTDKVDNFNFPTVSPGLFRLPADNFEATTQANLGTQSSFGDFRPEFGPNRFLSEPLLKSGRGFSRELFLTAPNGPFTYEIRPRLGEGAPSSSQTNRFDPYTDPSLPLIRTSYPFVPDMALGVHLNDEGTSRTFASSDSRLPPGTRFTSYDEHVMYRPNMHR